MTAARSAATANRRVADVVVIGDGIIGLSTALELADSGARCIVVGAENPGIASLAAAGILAPSVAHLPHAARPFYMASLARYPAFVSRLRDADPELELLQGLIELTSHDAHLTTASNDEAPDAGHLRRLTGAELASLEPSLAAAHGAILYSLDGAIDNVRLVAALRRTLGRSNTVAVALADPVRRIQFGAASATVTTASGARVTAGRVILAAGAWASNIDGLPRRLPLVPLKGQMLALGATMIRHAVMGTDIYIVPRGPETLVGATVEHAGFDTGTNAAAIDQLRRAAVALCPPLASAPVTRQWAGIRPATPDMLPILGVDPDVPELIYGCGHSKNGILLAPETGLVIARLARGLRAETDITPFSVTRFGAQ